MTKESPRIKMIDIRPCDECQEFMATHVIMDLKENTSRLLCPDCFEAARNNIPPEDRQFCNNASGCQHCQHEGTCFPEELYTGESPEINDRFIKADYDRDIAREEGRE